MAPLGLSIGSLVNAAAESRYSSVRSTVNSENAEVFSQGIVGQFDLYNPDELYTFDRGNNNMGYKRDNIIGHTVDQGGYTVPVTFSFNRLG